jgi:zinc protease
MVARVRRGHGVVGVAAALFVSCATQPNRGDTGIRPFAFDLADVRCPSGLRVVFERAPGAQTASVTTVVGAGGARDPVGREGLAHLVEHLSFRSHAPEQAPLGVRLHGIGASYNNAETSFDDTTYYALVPREGLRALLAAEGQRLMSPLAGIDEETFTVERDIVRNELRERTETGEIEAARAAAFRATLPAEHPYSRPIAGTHASLSALTLDDARAFVGDHYRLDEMTMVVIADLDLHGAEALLREVAPALYGDPQHPRAIAAPVARPVAPSPPAATAILGALAPIATPELWIGWSLPGGAQTSDRFTAQLWAWTGNIVSRWGRLDGTDVASLDVFVSPGPRASVLLCRASLTTGRDPETTLRQIEDVLPWLANDDIHFERRFGYMQLGLLRQLALDAESVTDRGRSRAAYTHDTGDLEVFRATIDAINAITLDGARGFARKYLGRERARATLVLPLPPETAPAVPISPARDLEAAIDRTSLGPQTLHQLARVQLLSQMRHTILPNGLQIVAVRRPGAAVVTATLGFHGGALGPPGIATAGSEALKFSSAWDSPAAYGISLEVSSSAEMTRAVVQAGVDNLTRALDMLSFAARSYEVEWPSERFAAIKLPWLRKREAAPRQRGVRAFWSALLPDNPLAHITTADEVAAVTQADLAAWADRTIAPGNAALVIVGDVDPIEAEASARDAFAGWQRAVSPVAAPAAARPAPGPLRGDPMIIHRPGATQAELTMGCVLPPVDARGATVNELAALVVRSRLWSRLREQSGSTYGVQVEARALRGGSATLTVEAAIDNGRLSSVVNVIRRFWKTTSEHGTGAEMVRRARDGLIGNRLSRYDTSLAIGAAVLRAWNNGWPLTQIDDQPRLLAGVTPADVDGVLRACAAGLVWSVVGDEQVVRAALAERIPPETSAPVVPPSAAPN